MTDTSFTYPPATRQDLVEQLPAPDGPVSVADPYRWLEDPDSPETKTWQDAQDNLFDTFRGTFSDNGSVRERLTELNAAGFVGPPVWRGEKCFMVRRSGDQEHAILVLVENGSERVLIDPMVLNADGTTTLDAWQPSKDGSLLAYQISEGGSEESTLYVIDVATGEQLDGPIDRARYSSVGWLPDSRSFFYVRRLAPELLPEDETQYHRRVYWHTVGADPSTDVEVFGAEGSILNYYSASVSMDGKWVIVWSALGTDPRNDLAIARLDSAEPHVPEWKTIISGEDCRTDAQITHDGQMWVVTDRGAPRGRIMLTDPQSPEPANWREVISERDDAVLEDFCLLDGDGVAGGKELLVSWTSHAVGEVTRHDAASGELRGSVPLPGLGAVGGLIGRPTGGSTCWFTYTDFVTNSQVWQFDAATGEHSVYAEPSGVPELPEITTQQVEFASADGTTIRMFVVSRADGLAADGAPNEPAPTILYGYGGFGLSLNPAFSAGIVKWVESGGRYVIASLRGGGEEGEQWHRAGMLGNKQNVFDDFLGAADALVERGFATNESSAISGGSNGGLLVGAAATQAPEKFAAVVCSAPLLDMVRYQLHGLGQTWAGEYGDAGKPEDVAWLHAYSPYHRVVEGTEYPAMLFTIFDGDSRVDPLHARKLCAALQHATTGEVSARPVLYRLERKVGHGARSLSRTLDLLSDSLLFMGHHTGWPAV